MSTLIERRRQQALLPKAKALWPEKEESMNLEQSIDSLGATANRIADERNKFKAQRDSLLAQLHRISKRDPQSPTCGPDAPGLCENGCIGCVARAAIANCEKE